MLKETPRKGKKSLPNRLPGTRAIATNTEEPPLKTLIARILKRSEESINTRFLCFQGNHVSPSTISPLPDIYGCVYIPVSDTYTSPFRLGTRPSMTHLGVYYFALNALNALNAITHALFHTVQPRTFICEANFSVENYAWKFTEIIAHAYLTIQLLI